MYKQAQIHFYYCCGVESILEEHSQFHSKLFSKDVPKISKYEYWKKYCVAKQSSHFIEYKNTLLERFLQSPLHCCNIE